MLKICLGPGGNCITAKDRTTLGSFERIAELKLNAQEVEFVRKVYLTEKTAPDIGNKAKELGISLTTHAPYAINLCSNAKPVVETSKKLILDTLKISELIGAGCAGVHAAYCSGLTPEQTFETLRRNVGEILDNAKQTGIKNVLLGVEVMAKESQFGNLDEVVNFCKQAKGTIPYIDWCHIFARNNGRIDYGEIFEKLKILKLDHIYSHFSNSKYNVNSKKFLDVHIPIGNHPPFEPLAREILKRKVDITIISESPILEQDSLKMREIFQKLGYKF